MQGGVQQLSISDIEPVTDFLLAFMLECVNQTCLDEEKITAFLLFLWHVVTV